MRNLRKQPRQGGSKVSKILEVELATLEKKRKHIEREHSDRFVLIHGDEIVGTLR